jgi:hypothetical protein
MNSIQALTRNMRTCRSDDKGEAQAVNPRARQGIVRGTSAQVSALILSRTRPESKVLTEPNFVWR